jgi:AraC family transcriptional activator of tynA and feaB
VLALRLESPEDPRVAAMKTIFTTAEVDPKSRFDYWHSVACKNLVDHDSEPESRQTFQATLKCGNLGSIGLVLFENSPMRVAHTKQHIAHANSEDYFLCRQIAGRLALEQEGREVVLQSGDMALVDPRLPYTGAFSDSSRMLVLKLPRFPLERRAGEPRTTTARHIARFGGETSFTSAFLTLLPNHTEGLSREAEDVIKDHVLDLVALCLKRARQE